MGLYFKIFVTWALELCFQLHMAWTASYYWIVKSKSTEPRFLASLSMDVFVFILETIEYLKNLIILTKIWSRWLKLAFFTQKIDCFMILTFRSFYGKKPHKTSESGSLLKINNYILSFAFSLIFMAKIFNFLSFFSNFPHLYEPVDGLIVGVIHALRTVWTNTCSPKTL